MYLQMAAILSEKQRSVCESQSGRIHTTRWTSQSDHTRARTHGSHPRRMRIVDSRNTTNFTEKHPFKWSRRESSTIR